ncbi:MAG: division/cell wall cluster transcriptional repressor MraZ, partial [Rubrivivax sp.]|nr:division/cell wall cluster transcriptional repressor MraZ [Rubrivivax sp.]
MSSMVFRGGPVLTLDGKGRITVPVRWRDMLVATVQGQLVVAKNPDGCLSLYPLPVWEQFEASLLSLTTEDEAWRRFFVGSATEVEIDSASRVLIPPELRSWAGLEREV